MATGEDIEGSAKQAVSILENSEIGGISNVPNPILDFEAIIEDIDKEINMEISRSNLVEKVDDNEKSNLEKHREAALSLGEEDIRERNKLQ